MIDNQDLAVNTVLLDKYQVKEKLGKGSFGVVYAAIDLKQNKRVAVKLEPRAVETLLLETEAYYMSYLKGDGFPNIYCYGQNQSFNILVMEVLGESLLHYHNKCDKKFSIKTICLLAIQMIERIAHLHQKNLIHRDLKPENFLMGSKIYKDKIYIIDFGLCSKYRSSTTKKHIPLRTGLSLTGTARYASINVHRGYGNIKLLIILEQSRRDDLESLGYILVYFFKSSLPWQGVKSKDFQKKIDKILDMKIKIPLKELCSEMPEEFVTYLSYCRNLKFEEEPDYKYLIKLFEGVLIAENHDPEEMDFDWDCRAESYIKRKMSMSPNLTMKYAKIGSSTRLEEFVLDEAKKKYPKSPEILHKNFSMVRRKDTVIDLIKLDPSPSKSSFKADSICSKNKKVSFKPEVQVFNHNEDGKLTAKEEKEINFTESAKKYRDADAEKFQDVFVIKGSNVIINKTMNSITINNYTIEEEKKENCIIF